MALYQQLMLSCRSCCRDLQQGQGRKGTGAATYQRADHTNNKQALQHAVSVSPGLQNMHLGCARCITNAMPMFAHAVPSLHATQ